MNYKGSSYILGEGAGSGYLSEYFEERIMSDKGRHFSEVGFLNLIIHYGIIGVVLFALILFSAIYYGVNRSKNRLTSIISFVLIFNWLLLFIENIPRYDLAYLNIWVMIGLCLSSKLRQASDQEIKDYLQRHLTFKFPKLILN